MRLRDRDRHDEGLDPQAEQELEAIERALAGTAVEPELADWAELAEMLGYSETRAFTRAFSQWTGMSPVQYREYFRSHVSQPSARS